LSAGFKLVNSLSQLCSTSSPALLSLASVLGTLASRVASVLDSSSDALKTIADGLGAGGVVEGLADAAASCANKASGSLGDTAYGISELCMCKKCDRRGTAWIVHTVEVPAFTAPSAPPLLDPVSIGIVDVFG
jgi:hypothetical protein